MASLALVSTQDATTSHRLDLWCQLVCQVFGRLRSETFGDKSFVGKLEHGQMGDIRVCKLIASRHRVVRTSTFAQLDDRGCLKVVLQKRGRSYFEQNGRSVVLSPGQWSIYDTGRSYTVSNPQSIEQLILMIPREKIFTGRVDLSQRIVRHFPRNTGINRLTYQFIANAFEEMPEIGAEAACGVSDTIAELIRLALLGQPADEGSDESALPLRSVQRDRIRGYIYSHLRDPELSIAEIASAIHCTKRYVHKVFQTEGTTVSDQICACASPGAARICAILPTQISPSRILLFRGGSIVPRISAARSRMNSAFARGFCARRWTIMNFRQRGSAQASLRLRSGSYPSPVPVLHDGIHRPCLVGTEID